MLGRGAAAAAHDVEAELADEALVRLGQAVGREVVVGVAVDHARQPGVGERRQERARVLREVAQVLGHLGRPGRAVHADHVGLHRFERGERGADLAAHEHAAGRLDRDLHHEREQHAGVAHRRARTVDRGLGLEQVVHGLDEQHVGAARDQPSFPRTLKKSARRVIRNEGR